MRMITNVDATPSSARLEPSRSAPGAVPWEIVRTPFTIGRSERCDLALDSTNVSREHAVIRRDANGFYVRDNQSTNGTFVNGRRTIESRLQDGDAVAFANVEFVFHVVGDGEERQTRTMPLSAAQEREEPRPFEPNRFIAAVRAAQEAAITGSFRFVVQPIVDLRTGETVGCDVQPRRDSIAGFDFGAHTTESRAAARFYSAARRLGLEQAAALRPGQWLLASLEPQELGRPETVRELAESRRQAAHPIVAALPDGAVADIAHFREFLSDLRDAGISVAYDGYARGGAQFASLQTILPDYLRLSPMLARGVDRSDERKRQIAGIVQAAEAAGVMTIATGVHHEDERETCRALGVAFAQGNCCASCQPLDALLEPLARATAD